MALIKRRPEISVVTTPEFVAGEAVAGEVAVTAAEAVPIDWIRISLIGEERGAVGSGKSRSVKEVELIRQVFELAGERELTAGEHRFAFAIPTTAGLPPSYAGRDAYTRYHLEVRVSIPWWPDAKKRYELIGRAPTAAADHPGSPLVLSSRPSGPRGTDAHVELSLAQSVVAPGDTLRGAVALSNVEHNRYHRLIFELRTIEEVVLGRFTRGVTRTKQFRYLVDVSDTGEGEQHEFTLAMPAAMPPTYASQLWSLEWQLRIIVDIRWALDLKFELSIPVVPHRFRNPAKVALLPAVGSPRVEAAWVQVAEDLGLELVADSLRGDFGGAVVHVYREHRGGAGIFLVGTLSYPDLHLDLMIAPGTGVFFNSASAGIQLGLTRFDGKHEVRCRDEAQARAFFAPLLETLGSLGAIRMDDDSLVTEIENNGTVSADLARFATPLVSLAKRITRARRDIPPPAAAAASIPIWKDLAAKLDGELDPSSMIVTGRFHGRRVQIETTWTPDGKPAEIATTVWLGGEIDPAATGGFHPSLVMDTLPDALPEAVRPLLESLTNLVDIVKIRRDSIAAATPWLAEPHDALSLVRTLSEIAEVLCPGAGPYR